MGAKARRTGAVVGGAEVNERRRRHGRAQANRAISLARRSFPWKPELRCGGGSGTGRGFLPRGQPGWAARKESTLLELIGHGISRLHTLHDIAGPL
jgi:hypothetical protein